MILTIAGKTYAQTHAEMVDSLFHASGTCAGFWRRQGRGVLLLDLQRIPFAYAARDGYSAFFVTAHKSVPDGGRTRYMFGLAEDTAAQLGIAGLRYSAQLDAARQAIMDAWQSECWPPVPTSPAPEVLPCFRVTVTFAHLNPRPGFVSAWDAARNHYGAPAFDALSHSAQILAVRAYVNR